MKFEICISDNSSSNENLKTVRIFRKKFKNKVKIIYHKFKVNKGVTINFLKPKQCFVGPWSEEYFKRSTE